MTLLELSNKISFVGNMFPTWQIPLKINGKWSNVDFVVEGDNDSGHIINMTINEPETKTESS